MCGQAEANNHTNFGPALVFRSLAVIDLTAIVSIFLSLALTASCVLFILHVLLLGEQHHAFSENDAGSTRLSVVGLAEACRSLFF